MKIKQQSDEQNEPSQKPKSQQNFKLLLSLSTKCLIF